MKRDTSDDVEEKQREEHSLPGSNMAGKGPGDDCEHPDTEHESRRTDRQANRGSDESDRRHESVADAEE